MEGHDVGARLGETRYVTLRLDDHQVHVEALCGHLADGLQHRKPEGDIGDEHAVHHVDMYPLGRTAVDHLRVAFQVAEIGRKHRRCYDSVHGSNITYDKYSHFRAVFHASERDSVPANPGFGVRGCSSGFRMPVPCRTVFPGIPSRKSCRSGSFPVQGVDPPAYRNAVEQRKQQCKPYAAYPCNAGPGRGVPLLQCRQFGQIPHTHQP